MNTSHALRLVALGACASLALAACAPGGSATQSGSKDASNVTIGLTYIPNIQFSPVYVADAQGMYNEAGRSFTQVLEREDPSEQYKGTALEGLDAYQRQLKRFDIKVKGAGSDAVEKCRFVPGVCGQSRAAGHGGGQPPAPHHRRRHPV